MTMFVRQGLLWQSFCGMACVKNEAEGQVGK